MKKKLPSAKVPLPKFRSDKAAAEYLETHSVAEVWDQLPEDKRQSSRCFEQVDWRTPRGESARVNSAGPGTD